MENIIADLFKDCIKKIGEKVENLLTKETKITVST